MTGCQIYRQLIVCLLTLSALIGPRGHMTAGKVTFSDANNPGRSAGEQSRLRTAGAVQHADLVDAQGCIHAVSAQVWDPLRCLCASGAVCSWGKLSLGYIDCYMLAHEYVGCGCLPLLLLPFSLFPLPASSCAGCLLLSAIYDILCHEVTPC